jgi:hypothetical protein
MGEWVNVKSGKFKEGNEKKNNFSDWMKNLFFILRNLIFFCFAGYMPFLSESNNTYGWIFYLLN